MADIFADLLGQYLGSRAVVQPLLPSLFAPLLPLVAERTSLFSDSQTRTPQETVRFADESFAPLATEALATQTDTNADASQQELAFAQAVAATSVLPASISALPFRHLLTGPRSFPVAAEPGPQVAEIQFEGPEDEISVRPQPFAIQRQALLENHEMPAVTSGPAFLPAESTGVFLLQEQSQPSERQESEQQSPVQRDEETIQDRQVPRLFKQDIYLPPVSETFVVSPSHPVSQTPVSQPVSLVQPRPEPASVPVISRKETEVVPTLEQEPRTAITPEQEPRTAITLEREPQHEFAEQKAFQPGRSRIAPSRLALPSDSVSFFQFAPLPGSQPSLQAIVPSVSESPLQIIAPSDPQDSFQTLPVSFKQEETPEASRLAPVSSQVVPGEQSEQERQTRQTFSQEQNFPPASKEPVAVQVFPGRERTTREEEREIVPVRIHIGRVVVRGTAGVSSTPPSSTKRTLRPALSLNEYLKQRERGSR